MNDKNQWFTSCTWYWQTTRYHRLLMMDITEHAQHKTHQFVGLMLGQHVAPALNQHRVNVW